MPLALLGVLFALITAAALPAPQHWEAVSNTAMSITGDVAFTPSRLTFANGKSLDLRYAGTRPISHASSTPHGTAQSFKLYQVVTRTNPTLLRGNVLCDETPTYVGVAVSPEHNAMTEFLNVYNGETAPTSWDSDELCASYTYALKH
jgi:hypothetical protein